MESKVKVGEDPTKLRRGVTTEAFAFLELFLTHGFSIYNTCE